MEQVRHEPACWPDGFYHLLFVLVYPGTPASHFGGKYAGPKCSNVSKAATVATIYATGHENRHDFSWKASIFLQGRLRGGADRDTRWYVPDVHS